MLVYLKHQKNLSYGSSRLRENSLDWASMESVSVKHPNAVIDVDTSSPFVP